MCGMEIATAVKEKVKLTVIVCNDGHLGLIRYRQLSDYGSTFGVDTPGIDFGFLAESLGAKYVVVENEVGQTLEENLGNEGVSVIDVVLHDSPQMRRIQSRRKFKEKLRRVAGDSLITRLKRFLGR
jgi:thiamine pyrophosphate-dependent acetolactate synthase large subunit-like protein